MPEQPDEPTVEVIINDKYNIVCTWTNYPNGSYAISIKDSIKKAENYHPQANVTKIEQLEEFLRKVIYPRVTENSGHMHEVGTHDYPWVNIVQSLKIDDPSEISEFVIKFSPIGNDSIRQLTGEVQLTAPDKYKEITLEGGILIEISAYVEPETGSTQPTGIRTRKVIVFEYDVNGKKVSFTRSYSYGNRTDFIAKRVNELDIEFAKILEYIYRTNTFRGGLPGQGS